MTNELQDKRDGTSVALGVHELEAVEGGYYPDPKDWCGTCRNPANPSGDPYGWHPRSTRGPWGTQIPPT